MTALQCDICGGSLTMDTGGEFATCESCTMKHDTRRLQQKVQEIRGIVKIDGSVQVEGLANIDNLLVRAKEFLDKDDYAKANEYCQKVLDIDATNSTAKSLIRDICFKLDCVYLTCNRRVFRGLNTNFFHENTGITWYDCNFDGAYERIANISQIPTEKELKEYRRSESFSALEMFLFFSRVNDIARAKCFKEWMEVKFRCEMKGGEYSSAPFDPQSWASDMHFWAIQNDDELLDLFKQNCENLDDLMERAVVCKHVSYCELFLKCGADPNGRVQHTGTTYYRYGKHKVKRGKRNNGNDTDMLQIMSLLEQYGAK